MGTAERRGRLSGMRYFTWDQIEEIEKFSGCSVHYDRDVPEGFKDLVGGIRLHTTYTNAIVAECIACKSNERHIAQGHVCTCWLWHNGVWIPFVMSWHP